MQGSKKTLEDAPEIVQLLQEALRGRFPCAEKLVGKPLFSRMIKQFLSGTAKAPRLNKALISQFIEFVSTYPSMSNYPQVENIILFEDALQTIQEGPDNAPLDYVNMARAITESTEKIVFHPPKGSILLSVDFPIIDIMSALMDNKSLNHQKFQKPRQYRVLIWKEEDTCRYEYLKNDEFLLLNMLQAPRPFITIYGQYLEKNTRTNIDELLPELCKKGYINHYSLP